MPWFPLALATAFFAATEMAILKRWFSDLTAVEMGMAPLIFLAPIFAVMLAAIPWPELSPGFLPLFLAVQPVNAAGFLCHISALHRSPMSLTMPLLSFTPAFAVLTGRLVLGESLNGPELVGIATIVAGGYVLGMSRERRGALAPVRAVLRDSGARRMLAASAIYALGVVMGKALILKSSPLFFMSATYCVFAPCMVLGFGLAGKVRFRRVLARPLPALAAALVMFLHATCHNLAIARSAAAPMLAVKRLSGAFSVIYGGLIFKERDLGYRLLGALVMGAGAAVLALFSAGTP